MDIRIFQTGWNYSQDGPGNRLIYHFQGCNFDCPWCSNPEGRSMKGELFVRPELLEPDVCPHGAVAGRKLQRALCLTCLEKECLHQNRNQGIRMTCREYTVDELVQTAVESRPMFFDGGGVTISGGEATLQFEGLKDLLRGLRNEGIHTTLETNGSHPTLSELLPHINLLIFDIKHWDFSSVSGILKNRGIHVIDNLRSACETGMDILLRITVIPGFNSSNDDMEKFAELIASLSENRNLKIEQLYYHTYGKSKWAAIGQSYEGPDSGVTEDEKKNFNMIFQSHGLNLIQT